MAKGMIPALDKIITHKVYGVNKASEAFVLAGNPHDENGNLVVKVGMLGCRDQNFVNNFKPLTGLGQILILALSVGAFGAIDGLSGIFPKVMVRLFQLFKSGKHGEALKLQYLVTRADRMIFDLNLAGVKHVLYNLYGYGSSRRPPLNNLIDEATWAKYDPDFKKLAAVESTL